MAKKGRPRKDLSSPITRLPSAEERELAKELELKYLKEYAIENPADRSTLTELIYYEVLQIRIQQKMNEFYSKDAKAIPLDLNKTMQENSKTIMSLKSQLGLNKPKEEDTYTTVQHLFERHKKWRENNQGSREIKCPHCFQYILLKIRTEAWEALKHPFFKDTFLFNKTLFDNIGKQVWVDREFLAKVFGVSPDYIDFVIEKSKIPHEETESTSESVEVSNEAVPDETVEIEKTGTENERPAN